MAHTNAQLALLQADLGLRTVDATQRGYLESLLETAQSRIGKLGIMLSTGDLDHDQLTAMYAAYLYRCRAEDRPMPRMLSSALHDELCRQKMAVTE